MNNSPTNYYTNGQDYYNFPAYRAVVGHTVTGMPPHQGQGSMQRQTQMQPMAPPPGFPSGSTIQGVPSTLPAPVTPGLLPIEQSYIENILRLNLGKVGTFYMTYENNTQWNAKIFKGKIEAAGRDHIIISDPKTGMRYLLLMVNLDYATFDEELKYTSQYQTGSR
jgi:spore germination protein Q